MLNQINSPYGVLWIAKTKNQDWDAMKMHTLVPTLLFCHTIQIVSVLYKKETAEHVLYGITFLSRIETGRFTVRFNKSFPHGWHFDGITYKLKALYRFLEINSLCNRSSIHGMNHCSQYCKYSECNMCSGCTSVTPEIIRKQHIFQTHISEHMLQVLVINQLNAQILVL